MVIISCAGPPLNDSLHSVFNLKKALYCVQFSIPLGTLNNLQVVLGLFTFCWVKLSKFDDCNNNKIIEKGGKQKKGVPNVKEKRGKEKASAKGQEKKNHYY